MGFKVKKYKHALVAYFDNRPEAVEIADMVGGRVVDYELGYAVQYEKGGAYWPEREKMTAQGGYVCISHTLAILDCNKYVKRDNDVHTSEQIKLANKYARDIIEQFNTH